MPPVTPALALIIFVAGTVAGALGALLGLGGGIFLVPFLKLVLGFPFSVAAAISLTTVIATSSTVSAARAGKQLINLRFGMLLEVATAAGSLLGGITAQLVAQSTLQRLFGVVAIIVALITLTRLKRRNVILDPSIDPGVLGGRFFEEESGVHGHVPHQAAAAGARRVVRRGQCVVAARHRRRHHQGAGAERVVRHAAARGGGDERVHDRRHRDGRRDHLLRPRAAHSGARRRGGARRPARSRGAGMRYGQKTSAKWLKVLMAVRPGRRRRC